MPEPTAEELWNQTADALNVGNVPAETVEKKEPTPVETKPAETKPAVAESVPDEQSPAIYYPEKYKNRAEEKRGLAELQSKLAELGDKGKYYDEFRRALADTTNNTATIKQLIEEYGVDKKSLLTALGVVTQNEEIDNLKEDDFVDVKTAKEMIAKAKTENEQTTQRLLTALTPLLKDRRMAELKAKYPLIDNPEVTEVRNNLDLADSEGTMGRDEILHLAAEALVLHQGKLSEVIETLLGENKKASATKTKQETIEPGVQTTRETKPISAEEQFAQKWDATFDVVPGR